MLYSSCKGPFLDTASNYLGVEISKKVSSHWFSPQKWFQMEVDAKDDLSEKALFETLHPAPMESPKHFAKPRPAAGNRRITKV